MNTQLLRMAHRYNGVRSWIVPGFGNGAKLVPSSKASIRGWGASFTWPAMDDKGEHLRTVDLNRHRKLAKLAARELLK